MNYTEFCRHNNHTTSLTKREIENPFIVLESLYKRRNPEDFKSSLWDFFGIIYKEQWKINGAAYYYHIYMDLNRLVDALWLIKTYQPECLAIFHPPPPGGSKQMNAFNQVFNGIRKKSQRKEEENQESNLDIFYSSIDLSCIKSYLYDYLYVGLNASYMDNNKYVYYGIQENEAFNNFTGLESLIEEGHNIYNNKTTAQNPGFKEHIPFATDSDHPLLLSLELINDPINYLTTIYRRDLIFKQVAESLKIWKRSLYEKDFWHYTDSPGNMLFFVFSLKEFVECLWIFIQEDQIKIDTAKKELSDNEKKLYPTLTEEELNQPFMVIKSFFEHKKMHEWRTQLDEWTNICLSDTKVIPPEKADETSLNFKHLLRFIEASHLMAH